MKNTYKNFYLFLFMISLIFVAVSCSTDLNEDLTPSQENEIELRHSGVFGPGVTVQEEEDPCEASPFGEGGYELIMKRSFWEPHTICTPSTVHKFILPDMDECVCKINEFRTEFGNSDCTEIAKYCHWVSCEPTDNCDW